MEGAVECSANNIPLLTPVDFLERAANVYRDKVSIIYGTEKTTWGETHKRCIKLASAMVQLGISRGDIVVAFVPDVPALYELHFSVPMVGAVISALNTKLDTTMLASLLEELEAKMIFVYYEFIEVVLEALNMPSKRKDNPPQLVLIVDQYDQNSSSIVKKNPPGSLNYNELLAMGQADFEIIRPNNECDPISVNYTSGSTGAPKGEKYSHRATYHNSLKSIFSIDMRRMSVFLWTVDMFHCNGWCFTWAVAAIGGTNICLGSTLTAKLIFDAIFDHNVTHLCGAPNILNIIAESPACDRRKLPFKVDIFVAGASPTTQVLNKVVELGFNVRDGYGMTEALVPASVTPPELPIELAESVEAPNSSNGDGGDGGGGGGGGVEERRGPRFKDLGGMEAVIQALKMEVFLPLYRPELLQRLGIRPMSGILLHGPPGCGKTKLAHAIANETGVRFHKISATEIISCVYGEPEKKIRDLFSKAYKTAPSIVFIDEIDAIASERKDLDEVELRIVTQLLTCMDEFQAVQPAGANSNSESSEQPGYVLVIGATNRPYAIDPALRRPGRFDREIVLGVPDEGARVKILSVITGNLTLEGSLDILKIARSTPGFVGADLADLANKAGILAIKRIIDERKSELPKVSISEECTEDWWRQPWLPEEMEKLTITMTDFEEALKMVQPSLKREGFSSIPNVKWEDVGGLGSVRKEFDRYIVGRIKHPEVYEKFGMDLETGFLLYGPPGCGKTLIAKAVANEAGANFIHIKGPELLNKYLGESERAVRTLFSRARTCSPCILFFDEVDALTATRGQLGGYHGDKILNQLLIELDGAEQRRGVFVIGATNRPEVIDPAVLRPGRFGKLLYVPLPSPDERGLILKALARKKPIDASVDLSFIARMVACENFSGADLAALMNEAAMLALEDRLTSTETTLDAASCTIKLTHFEQAVGEISPSVIGKRKQRYTIFSEQD